MQHISTMPVSITRLCDELHIDPAHGDERQLSILKQWCEAHISQDISYQGNTQECYKKYIQLTEQYNFFLSHIPHTSAHMHETIAAFHNQTSIQYAALHGYDRYLTQLPSLPQRLFNQRNESDGTPLHIAAIKGHVYTLKTLLSKGANPHLMDKSLKLPIHDALFVPTRYTATYIANKEAIFRELMSVTPEWKTHQDQLGHTALHLMAVATYGQAVFDRLFTDMTMEDTSGIFIRNTAGQYPIHLALLNHNTEIAKTLLDHVPDVVQLKDKHGNTVLHYAAQCHTALAFMEQCLEHDLPVDALNYMGKTPLYLATEVNNLDAMTLLLQRGADATLPDKKGNNILDIATAALNDTLVTWITEHTPLGQHARLPR